MRLRPEQNSHWLDMDAGDWRGKKERVDVDFYPVGLNLQCRARVAFGSVAQMLNENL